MQTSFWDSSCSFESQRKIWMQCFQNGKTEKQCLEQLQLHAGSEIPEELIYQEMCQLTGLYIYSCSKDVNYTSMIWGFGKKSDEKISEKINLDLERIGEAIPKYLSMEECAESCNPGYKETVSLISG